jgi:hypothetical protein
MNIIRPKSCNIVIVGRVFLTIEEWLLECELQRLNTSSPLPYDVYDLCS